MVSYLFLEKEAGKSSQFLFVGVLNGIKQPFKRYGVLFFFLLHSSENKFVGPWLLSPELSSGNVLVT